MKAFPTEHPIVGTMGLHADGMDLRDYFAAKAMQCYWADPDVTPDLKTASAWSYDMADAMMKARNDS